MFKRESIFGGGALRHRWLMLWLLLGLAWPASAELIGENHAMQVLESGDGWMVVDIRDLESDGAGTEVYVAVGIDGVLASPMPAQEKAKLTASSESEEAAKGQERIFIVHKDIVDGYWKNGAVPEQYAAFSSSACGTYTGRIAESFAPALPPFVGSQPMSEISSSGTLDGEIRLEVGVEAELDVVVEYEVGKTLCIPSSVAILYVDMEAVLRLVDGSLAMEVEASKTWMKTYEKQIANPRLWVLPFTVGPIPVVINFKLPTKIGIDLSTGIVARTEIEVPWSGEFGFDYRCDASGCGGSSSHSFDFQNPLNNAQADVEVDLSAKPFLDSRVRANLYSDRIFYADVGLRAGIQNRLWGYFGNGCGDADGDGVNELVQGAIFDSYFDLQLPYSYGGLITEGEEFVDLFRRSIYFHDFLNPIENNAMAPSIQGPQEVLQLGYYQLLMRPCYPFTANPVVGLSTDLVRFQSSDTYNLASMPDGANRRFDFDQTGLQELKAVNQRDAIGRSIGSYSVLEVDVEEGGGGPSDPCDPDCPPTIIYDFFTEPDPTYRDPTDLRREYYEIVYSLGWDFDISQYPPGIRPTILVKQSLFLEVDDTDPVLTEARTRTAPLSRLDDMALVQWGGYQFADHTEKIRKVCVLVDPDLNHDITQSEIETEVCVQTVGTQEIVLMARKRPGTTDVELEWNDDDATPDTDDFDLYRSKDGGSFVLIASGISLLYYDDLALSEGEYQYAIDSHGERYFSNTVVFASSALPIDFYDQRFFYDDEGGPRMTVQLTDDIAGSDDLHRHEMRIDSGGWLGAGLDRNLSIDSGALLDGLADAHQITFRTARWVDGQQDSPWYESPAYPILIRDWRLRASSGGPPDGDVPSGAIRVTFENQPDVFIYRLERRRLSTGSLVLIDTAVGSPYLDRNVEVSEIYAYRIRAFDEPWSASSEGMAFAGDLPGIPSFFQASDDRLNEVHLTWEGLGEATSYEIYRRESYVSQPTAADLLATVPATAPPGGSEQYSDTSAPVDVPLYYWVRGVNVAGNGGYANTTGYRPTIIQTDLADLTVSVLSAERVYVACKKPPCPDRPLLIRFRVTNQGDASVPAGFVFDAFLSEDRQIDGTDLQVRDQAFQLGVALDPGQSLSYTVTEERLEDFVGQTFYVLVRVDPLDFILESDETNNTGDLLIESLPN